MWPQLARGAEIKETKTTTGSYQLPQGPAVKQPFKFFPSLQQLLWGFKQSCIAHLQQLQ